MHRIFQGATYVSGDEGLFLVVAGQHVDVNEVVLQILLDQSAQHSHRRRRVRRSVDLDRCHLIGIIQTKKLSQGYNSVVFIIIVLIE